MKSGGGCVKPARGCENPSRDVIEVRAARRDPPGRLSRSIAEMPGSKSHTGFGHARWTCSEPVKRRGGSVNHQAVSHASSRQWGFEIPPSTDCLLRVLLCRWKQAEAVTSQDGSVNAILRRAAAVGRREAERQHLSSSGVAQNDGSMDGRSAAGACGLCRCTWERGAVLMRTCSRA